MYRERECCRFSSCVENAVCWVLRTKTRDIFKTRDILKTRDIFKATRASKADNDAKFYGVDCALWSCHSQRPQRKKRTQGPKSIWVADVMLFIDDLVGDEKFSRKLIFKITEKAAQHTTSRKYENSASWITVDQVRTRFRRCIAPFLFWDIF